MKDKNKFLDELNQLARWQYLLSQGMGYDESYYLVYNKWHSDYLREHEDSIGGAAFSLCDTFTKLEIEPSQCKH